MSLTFCAWAKASCCMVGGKRSARPSGTCHLNQLFAGKCNKSPQQASSFLPAPACYAYVSQTRSLLPSSHMSLWQRASLCKGTVRQTDSIAVSQLPPYRHRPFHNNRHFERCLTQTSLSAPKTLEVRPKSGLTRFPFLKPSC